MVPDLNAAIGQTDVRLAATASALLAAVWLVIGNPLVAIAISGAPLALLIAIRKPFQLCLVFVALSFFRLHEAFPQLYAFKLPLIIGALCLFALAWHVVIERTITPVWPTELKWFAALFAWPTVGMVFAVNRAVAVGYWSDVFSKIGIMTLAIAWLMRGTKEINQATRMIVISSALVSLVAFHNQLNQVGLVLGGRVTVGRNLNSPLGDPNDLALALLLPLSFAMTIAIKRTGAVNRLLGRVAVPGILWCIIATQSRGGLIGVFAVFAVIGMRMIRSRLLVAALGAALILVLAVATNIAVRPDLGNSLGGLDDSALDRIRAWHAALNMAFDRPLFGVGLSNFPESMYFYSERWSNFRDMAAHSTWLTVLAETGLPGFIAFIGMIIAMFKSLTRSMAKLADANAPQIATAMAVSLLAGLCGFCAAGTFLTQAFTWPIYIMLALTVAIGRYAEEAKAASPINVHTDGYRNVRLGALASGARS